MVARIRAAAALRVGSRAGCGNCDIVVALLCRCDVDACDDEAQTQGNVNE
jgi:hypothetical protein